MFWNRIRMSLTIVVMITLTFSRPKCQYFEMKTVSQIIPFLQEFLKCLLLSFWMKKKNQKNRNFKSQSSVSWQCSLKYLYTLYKNGNGTVGIKAASLSQSSVGKERPISLEKSFAIVCNKCKKCEENGSCSAMCRNSKVFFIFIFSLQLVISSLLCWEQISSFWLSTSLIKPSH